MDGLGIGRALRTARIRRGKSLEEASRETRVRTEYLVALEHETFDALLGDVYVRGFLRSYSRYLGLNPDKVLSVYERAYGPPPEPDTATEDGPPPGAAPPKELASVHRRPNWLMAASVAAVVLLSAGAIGLLSRTKTPPVAVLTSPPPTSIALPDRPVRVSVTALQDVSVMVAEDGSPVEELELERGEARSFEGETEIHLRLEVGGSARLEVNGQDLGAPGLPTEPYEETFTPDDFREEPSPTGP